MPMCILIKDNKRNKIAVKTYLPCHVMRGYNSTPQEEVTAFQNYYDRLFEKDRYTFFIGDSNQADSDY